MVEIAMACLIDHIQKHWQSNQSMKNVKCENHSKSITPQHTKK